MKKIIVYAHRGASMYAPENTISAFNKAIDLNSDGIELDLRRTKDNKIVVFHDEKINKKSSGIGKVIDYTYEELRKNDFGSWFSNLFKDEKIILFEDFAKMYLNKNLYFSVELKDPKIEKDVIKIINMYASNKDKISISSFDYKILKSIRKIDKNINISWLRKTNILIKDIKKLKRIKGSEIAVPANMVDIVGISLAKENNIDIRVWGIQTESIMKSICNMDINSITIDFPDKAKMLLNKKEI